MIVNFESLRKLEKDQAVSDHDAYQELLRKLSRGDESPDNPAILPLLERVGRSVDQLEADFQWRARRDKEIAVVKEGPALEAEKAELHEKLNEMYAEVTKAKEKYREQSWPLEARLNEIKEKLHWVMVYSIMLPNDCRDQNIQDELDAISEQKNGQRIRHLEGKAKEIQQQIMLAQQELDKLPATMPGRKEKKQELKARTKDLQMRYEKTQMEIVELQRKDAEIEARAAELREAMIFA